MATDTHILPDDEGNLGDFVEALKRRKRLALITAVVIFVLSCVAIFVWPTSYKSTATILLEEPEVPETLVQTTVTTFAAEQIQYINQRVMTRTNLAQIIEKFDLYADKRRYTPTLLLTDEMQDHIQLDLVNVELTDPARGIPVANTIAFTLGFVDRDAETAQQVANELVSLYMKENVRSRTVQTVETREFLGGEGDRLEQKVQDLEQQVATFKKANEGSLPELTQVHLNAIQRLDSQLLEVGRELKRIEETRILLDAQLTQVDPTQPMILPDGTAVLAPADQLKSLQTKLATLRGQYNANHPDVVRTEREIEALRTQTGLTADFTEITAALTDARSRLAIAREKYNPDHPEVIRLSRMVDSLANTLKAARDKDDALVKPDNPAYIQLSSQKEQLRANETALYDERDKLKAKLAEYEQKLTDAPRVEQKLSALQRQLQSASAQLYALREREFSAHMGEALETQSKGERFVLVEPANFPLEPSSPNRPVLLLLMLIISPILGVCAVPLREAMDNAIWGAKAITEIQGAPPIAEIPLIETAREQVYGRRMRLAGWLGGVGGVMALALTVHFLIKPLDVLWFVVLRKLGI